MSNRYFSLPRLLAVVIKEFVQMRRDRLTFAMIILIPLMQLILFGYAINTNPKDLPTAIIAADQSNFVRSFITALDNTKYFYINKDITDEKIAANLLALGRIQFVINFPPDFTRRLVRGLRPQIGVEADATDPVAASSAMAAISNLATSVFNPLLVGPLQKLRPENLPPAEVVMHAKYNPESITQYNIVPGLMGVVITMTMVIITAMGITKERERGNLENLLATPIKPIEVMIGKITPYIITGYAQAGVILLFARYLFGIPFHGSVLLLLFASLPFIAANLCVGLTFSSLAKTQLQASQMAVFFFLPSILLSGFMFPFRGMPMWAQYVGDMLPLTYFLRIVRGIILKGNGWALVWHDLWPILAFMVVAMAIGLTRFRKTLD
jgi:ABC-2 type transport system permease protein